MDLFPYQTRPHQEALISAVKENLGTGEGPDRHLVMESPTGSGKTICTLAPALEASLEHGLRMIYTTRTNSQQLQVLKELRQVTKASKKRILGIGIQGRGNMCLNIRDHPDWADGSPEELAAICGDLKRISRAGEAGKGCPYFKNLLACDRDKVVSWVKENLPTTEELVAHCEDLGICPYELAKGLMPDATVVVAPYIFVFHPQVRTYLMDWSKMDPRTTVLIVDEAHNLPEFIRELRSLELGQVSLKRAIKEAKEFGDPSLAGGIPASRFCRVLEETLLNIEHQYIVDDDGLVPADELDMQLMSKMKMTSPRIQGLVKELMVHGDIIRETKRKAQRLPRSYLGRIATFLAMWSSIEGGDFVRLIRRDRNQVALQAYCMDPTVAGEVLCSMASTIHMSGTLSPLEEYRDSVGLPKDTTLRSFPNPFPKENLLVLYTDQVTTQYETLQRDGEMLSRIRACLLDIISKVPCNTALFFPSFELMRRINSGHGTGPFLSQELEALDRRVFVEVQGDQAHLMDMLSSFKEASCDPGCQGAVLFSVSGGRVSEGMDFPEKELEMAVIVGIPYPKPTAKLKALQYFYDMRFGKGWEYIVKGPTERKILQTIGRLVRSETDVGGAVILDSRAVHFIEKVPDLVLDNEPGKRLDQFFAQSPRRSRAP
jgi:DNA excision repair protein ERCC-2